MSPLVARYSGICKILNKCTNKQSPRRGGVDALLSLSSLLFFFELADSEYRRSARYQRLFFLMFTFLLFSVSYFFLF